MTEAPSSPPPQQATPETIAIRRFHTTVRVSGESTGGAMSVLEHTLPAGFVAMPLHTHSRETEVTHVLEGTLTVQVGDDVVTAGPGTYVVKPAGIRHTFWNESERPVRFLEITTPGGVETFYREVSSVIDARGKPDITAIKKAALSHGMEFEMASLMDLLDRYGVRLS
ncbi:MAG TPA: cupin domain-containing protein [Longimicrobiaceae bacterium]|nr:cupin domain-containing protein [Longimicrobiaceae bacterium]